MSWTVVNKKVKVCKGVKGNVYISWTAQYIHAVSAFFFFVLLNGHLGSSLH